MANRDTRGQFQPGHSVKSPGRPPRGKEAKYLQALSAKVTLTKWREIIDKALTDAIAGDDRARRWISEYLIGKPVQTIELTAVDQALLNELLGVFGDRGISAATIFEAMIQQAIEMEEAE